jgi:hypothetical protein
MINPITSRKIRLFLSTFISTAIFGCASNNVSGPDFEKKLREGEVRLTCGSMCQFSFSFAQIGFKQDYDNQKWTELAEGVARNGLDIDLAYYYLGYASEKKGYLEAAEKYYELGLESKRRCPIDTVIDCGGFSFPEALKGQLDEIASTKYAKNNNVSISEARKIITQQRKQAAIEKRRPYATQFPYEATIICWKPDIVFAACLQNPRTNTNAELILRNGNEDTKIYTGGNFDQIGRLTSQGFVVPLRNSFSIAAVNLNPDNLPLYLIIKDTLTDEIIYRQQVDYLGAIKYQKN